MLIILEYNFCLYESAEKAGFSLNKTHIIHFAFARGVGAKNCPAQSISFENGKNYILRNVHVEKMKTRYSPGYGDGKCRAGTPCAYKAPGLRKLNKGTVLVFINAQEKHIPLDAVLAPIT